MLLSFFVVFFFFSPGAFLFLWYSIVCLCVCEINATELYIKTWLTWHILWYVYFSIIQKIYKLSDKTLKSSVEG